MSKFDITNFNIANNDKLVKLVNINNENQKELTQIRNEAKQLESNRMELLNEINEEINILDKSGSEYNRSVEIYVEIIKQLIHI